jgi:hypothetical protein
MQADDPALIELTSSAMASGLMTGMEMARNGQMAMNASTPLGELFTEPAKGFLRTRTGLVEALTPKPEPVEHPFDVEELTQFLLDRNEEDSRVPVAMSGRRDLIQSMAGSALPDSPFAVRNPTLPTLAREWLQLLAMEHFYHPAYQEKWIP